MIPVLVTSIFTYALFSLFQINISYHRFSRLNYETKRLVLWSTSLQNLNKMTSEYQSTDEVTYLQCKASVTCARSSWSTSSSMFSSLWPCSVVMIKPRWRTCSTSPRRQSLVKLMLTTGGKSVILSGKLEKKIKVKLTV